MVEPDTLYGWASTNSSTSSVVESCLRTGWLVGRCGAGGSEEMGRWVVLMGACATGVGVSFCPKSIRSPLAVLGVEADGT